VQIRNRHNAVLQVNNIALTKRTTAAVFDGMCGVLKSLVPYDRALLSLYDADRDDLQIVQVCGPRINSFFHVGQRLSRNTTQSGWAFEHKATMFRGDLRKDYRFSLDSTGLQEGFVSICSVPLIVWGQSIGVVTVAAAQRNHLSIGHAEIVQEVSNQIALAINSHMLRCPTHANSKLLCPRCIGATGGKMTVAKHRENLSDWGKKGGRGHKQSDFA
jgi:GAF domain-containing protein